MDRFDKWMTILWLVALTAYAGHLSFKISENEKQDEAMARACAI
jgi:hypothetical protein